MLGDETSRPVPTGAAKPPVEAAVSSQERLRRRYRPDDMVVLLVGESAPAGGTFFYQGDSTLFTATREAFERAFGSMPVGEGFLGRFREMGFWLYDLADEPVNRRPGRPRKYTVSQGVTRLSRLVEDADPDFVIAVKTSLEGPVRRAASLAGFPAHRLLILPFPLYQWREEYVRELARFLNRKTALDDSAPTIPAAERLTLHEAMRAILEDADGGPVPARQVANEIGRRGLYVRQDGGRADYQQVLLRARKYPAIFEIGPRGVGLRGARP